MPIFTARSNFKTEFITGHRRCQSCMQDTHGTNALVVRWKSGKASLVLCDEECWSIYDHNFWLLRAYEETQDEREQDWLISALLPRHPTENDTYAL
jgi:hypothetical protein